MIRDFNHTTNQWEWRKMTATEFKNSKLTSIANLMVNCHAMGYWRAGSVVDIQVRVLHPFGFIEKLIEALAIPVLAIISESSIQDYYKEWAGNMVWWKFKTPNI